MPQLPLTVLITCKNEQQDIWGCLQSAEQVAGEILVADSGSTDNTLGLIHEFRHQVPYCRLIEREYVNSGNFKNWAIPQASHPWIFVLDADERINRQLADFIIRQVQQDSPQHDGYWIRRENYFLGKRIRYGDWGTNWLIRLFRRDLGRYLEYTDHAEIDLPADRLGQAQGALLHHSFTDYQRYLFKMERYANQQAKLWYDSGRRPSRWRLVANGLGRFLRSYMMRGGFLDGAIGFQLAAHTAYYSFLKQAELWAVHYRACQASSAPKLPGPLGVAPEESGSRAA